MGPQFSYGQAFMAELVPRGREYMFFSLLGIVSKGSSWIGPIVCSAIVDANGNQVRFAHFIFDRFFFYHKPCPSQFYPQEVMLTEILNSGLPSRLWLR